MPLPLIRLTTQLSWQLVLRKFPDQLKSTTESRARNGHTIAQPTFSKSQPDPN